MEPLWKRHLLQLVLLTLYNFFISNLSLGSVDDSFLSFPEAVPATNTNDIENIFLGHIIEMQELGRGRPDHVNYRQLLWQCMEKFSGLAEGRSRLLVPLLYQFIESVNKTNNFTQYNSL